MLQSVGVKVEDIEGIDAALDEIEEEEKVRQLVLEEVEDEDESLEESGSSKAH